MRHSTLEVALYVACAAVAGVMVHVNYAAGRPPWFFWVLSAMAALGLVRIFQIAWHEDRALK